jgi:hypothetical protein
MKARARRGGGAARAVHRFGWKWNGGERPLDPGFLPVGGGLVVAGWELLAFGALG